MFSLRFTFLFVLTLTLFSGVVFSQEPTEDPLAPNRAQELAKRLPPWPDLTIPDNATVEQLIEFVSKAKELQPINGEQFLKMQTAIRDSSRQILEKLKEKKGEAYEVAEFDYISSSVNMLSNEGPEAQVNTFNRFRDYLKTKKKLTANDLSMSLIATANLEQLSTAEKAIEGYKTFAKIIADKKDPTFVPYVELLQGNVKRLELPGKEVSLAGKTITDEDFDLKELRGKIVLINVWATIAPPCIEEYPYLRKLYETYRDKGFEIVGVNIDSDRDAMMKFVREAEVPWINLWENGGTHPFTTEYGINALPTMILVDREGKVVALEARGIILGSALSKMFDEGSTVEAAPEKK